MKQSYFSATGNWYKGNLHTHSTVTDGKQTPEERVNSYQQHGYSFLALTDHNILAAYPDLCSEDFIALAGVERNISGPETATPDHCIHIVGISEREHTERVSQPLVKYPLLDLEQDGQMLLDEMISDGQLCIVAHPVWSRMTLRELSKLNGHVGIEVYNQTCDATNRTGHSDYLIDCCLREGKQVYLFATDDCHSANPEHDMFGGWIVVKADRLTQKDLLGQIKKGSFYASTGPEIYDFGIDGQTMYIECSPCEHIHFITYECRGKSVNQSGVTSATYQVKGNETFVRCECVDSRGKIAYTNPVFVKGK
ncbi:MAG: hypothetical protein WDA00_02285 [Eubacteriales bacterium]